MRFVSAIVFFLSCLQQVYAGPATHHFHPQVQAKVSAENPPKDPSNCTIEIINDSFSHVTIYGRFDDGLPLKPFDIYSYETSHFIDLYADGYCHSGMYLSVITFQSGYTLFAGYVFTGTTVHVVPFMQNQLTVKMTEQQKA